MADPTPTPTPPVDPAPPVAPVEPVETDEGKARAIKDMLAYKAKLKDAEKKLSDLETTQKKEKEQYKELYEAEAKARKELEDKQKLKDDADLNREKYSALKDECVKLGIRAEAISDLKTTDMSKLLTETDDRGDVSVVNARQIAEALKASKPHWFGSPGAPGVNTNSPSVVTGGSMTAKSLLELEAKWKKSRSPEDEKNYRDALMKMKTAR